MPAAPDVITRYVEVAARDDIDALVACFTPDGVVLDEGATHEGRDAIRRWREALRSRWTYTSTVTGSTPIADGRYDVTVHVEGDFPGGVVDLTYAFVLRDGLIQRLEIT